MNFRPLVVDLDGTLIRTDMLHESALRALRDAPLQFLRIPFWLLEGKASLKRSLAERTAFDPQSLPYNDQLISWLMDQKKAGRKIVLCTASDQSIANSIAQHLGIFDEVIGSDGATNVAGVRKAHILEQRFGKGGFDYAGNSTADIPVWKSAHRAIIVNASRNVEKKAKELFEIEHIFPKKELGLFVFLRMLRVHQWLKNLLLFVPLLAAHELTDIRSWLSLILAFVSFSFCASTVYIANDLLDLESDRQHPRKRKRPFASGIMPAWIGVLLAPFLFTISMCVGMHAGKQFLPWLIFYFFLTCIYSWSLKRLVLVDCLTLAVLYTLRIISGAAALGQTLSFWLLAFSVFLFLSLAFVKRYAELEVQLLSKKEKIHGRGYYTTDAPLVQSMGIVSGYVSILVLALYLNSEAVVKLYRSPEMIWGGVLVMLFWVNWMWMQAHRGKMHDDPLVFAVKDKVSLLAGMIFAAVLIIGALGMPW